MAREPDADDRARKGHTGPLKKPAGRSETTGDREKRMAALAPAFPARKGMHRADSRRDLGKKPY